MLLEEEMFRPLAQEMARPRQDLERVRELAGDVFDICGFIDVKAGESYCDIVFPIRFYERPNFGFGFELGESQRPTEGQYPTISASIGAWDLGRRGATGAAFYTGATLFITLAPYGVSGSLHYRFVGPGLVGDSGESPAVQVL
jgi:hypothetical protein